MKIIVIQGIILVAFMALVSLRGALLRTSASSKELNATAFPALAN